MPRKLLLLFPILILFWGLSYAPLWNPDEGRYASSAYEMAFGLGPNSATGVPTDWVVPHLNTLTRLNKPPLAYWLTALNFQMFGPSEWSARLGATLGSLLVLVLIYYWGTRAFSRRVGFGGALIWATAIFPAAMGRISNTDMLLCAGIFLVGFGIFWSLEDSKPWRFGALAGLGMAMAVLAKGPIGAALPLLVVFIYLFASRSWKKVPWGVAALAFVLGIGLSAPWFLAVEARQSGFIKQFLLDENLKRFAGGEEFHKPSPASYYVPVVIAGLLPWTWFLSPALARWREESSLAFRTRLFAVLWALLIVAFFSRSETKLASYILPAFPGFCLLLGIALGTWERAPRWSKNTAISLSIIANLILAFVLVAVPKKDKISRKWHLAPGILVDNRIWPRERGVPWVWGLGAVMATSSSLLLLGARRNNGRAMIAGSGAGATGNLVAVLALAGQIAPYEDASGIVIALKPHLKSGDKIVSYRAFMPTTIFYTGQPVTFFDFRNRSGLLPHEVEASPLFIARTKRADLLAWQAQNPGRTFLLADRFLDARLAPHYHWWGRNNDFFLYSTAPKPADFTFEKVAPLRVNSDDIQPKAQLSPEEME